MKLQLSTQTAYAGTTDDAVSTNDIKSIADFTLVFLSLFVLKLLFLKGCLDVKKKSKGEAKKCQPF